MQKSARVTLGLVLLVVGASCSSSGKSGAGSAVTTTSRARSTSSIPAPPTTAPVDPNQVPNAIPYDVGALVGLPNGWRVQVAGVTRPLTATALPALAAGQQYVGVSITMINAGTFTIKVVAHGLFTIVDESGQSHSVVAGAAGATGLDGNYTPGARRSGALVFAVPVGKHLQMDLDGPAIHTQKSVFAIDPAKVPQQN